MLAEEVVKGTCYSEAIRRYIDKAVVPEQREQILKKQNWRR